MNWDTLLRKEYKAPFIPIIKSEVDVSNFDRVLNYYYLFFININDLILNFLGIY